MRLAYATTFDARDVHNWSGTPYHMSRALENAGFEMDYIGDLKRKLPSFFKLRQVWNKYVCHQRLSPRFNTHVAKAYSAQVAKRLTPAMDAVISPLINPIAYLECKQPIVLWTDAVYAALLGFYPPFSYHAARSVLDGNAMTASCLSRASLAIFSSEWAANSAIELYGASRDKVKVVTYGANLETYPSHDEIKAIISKRPHDTIKLLFLAKSWERKGGDIVVNVTKALHEAGYRVELNIVGVYPDIDPCPPYIKRHGFISKNTADGKATLANIINESHFLFLPSRADACPMVFAEANAFGLPCLTTYVGGIASAVHDGVNGKTFALDAPVNTYCDYIVDTLHRRPMYEALALSSHHEYESRLNWQAATTRVKGLLADIA